MHVLNSCIFLFFMDSLAMLYVCFKNKEGFMKNIHMSKYLLFAVLLMQSAQTIKADDCCPKDCCDQVYDCGDPLNCGSVNLLFHAGVAPTLWRDRGNFSAISCNALAAVPNTGTNIINFFELPKFSKLFHVPWYVGGQIGYAVTDCFEFYFEANYRQASHKHQFEVVGIEIPNDTVTVLLNLRNKYQAFDAYVGARYYWGRWWCDRIAFFLGGKFGLVHHKSVCFDYTITSTFCPAEAPLASTSRVPLFFKNTVPASGLNFGFDWCVGCGWSVVLMGEVVATCGPKSNGNIPIAANCSQLSSIMPSNLIVGGTGTELFFPVTLGLKYSF